MCRFDLSEHYKAWLDQIAAPTDTRLLTNHSKETRVLLNGKSVEKKKDKRVKISPRPCAHYTEKFENTALFLRLDQKKKKIRHGNGASQKTIFKPEEFENAGLAF